MPPEPKVLGAILWARVALATASLPRSPELQLLSNQLSTRANQWNNIQRVGSAGR